jgi:hypothetical protein
MNSPVSHAKSAVAQSSSRSRASAGVVAAAALPAACATRPQLNTHLHAVVADGVFEKAATSDGAQGAMFRSLPSLQPVELIAVAFNVYRRFAAWLKKKGLIRLADADDLYEREDPLASCLSPRHWQSRGIHGRR